MDGRHGHDRQSIDAVRFGLWPCRNPVLQSRATGRSQREGLLRTARPKKLQGPLGGELSGSRPGPKLLGSAGGLTTAPWIGGTRPFQKSRRATAKLRFSQSWPRRSFCIRPSGDKLRPKTHRSHADPRFTTRLFGHSPETSRHPSFLNQERWWLSVLLLKGHRKEARKRQTDF